MLGTLRTIFSARFLLLLLFVSPSDAFVFFPSVFSSTKLTSKLFSEEAELMSGEPKKHIRRARYSGKYPKKYTEKYKELRGDQEVVDRVLEKGSTPAGTHIPIMLQECLDHMRLPSLSTTSSSSSSKPITIDCTLGYGGHSKEIMKRVLPMNGIHIAIDQDDAEIIRTESRLRGIINESISDEDRKKFANQNLIFVNENFKSISEITDQLGVKGQVTALLADLGFSSMQIDDASRGFTYKHEGPLDMRMNRNSNEKTASDVLASIDLCGLVELLETNADEPFAVEIAQAIMEHLPITTTDLAECVRKGCTIAHVDRKLPPPHKHELNAATARVMQAIRIEVNQEFAALDELLKNLPSILAKDGSAVFLTFHSGEDRRVKKSFKENFKSGIYSSWSRDVVVASQNERRGNPRSKCAKLRWCVKQ